MSASPTTRAWGRAAMALLALLFLPPALQAQQVRGRVVDEEGDRGVADVRIALLDRNDNRIAGTLSDSAGTFLLGAPRAGTYTLVFEHVGYTTHRTEPAFLATGSLTVLEVRLSRGVYRMDPVTVTARGRRHDATYEGLYARIARSPSVGHNRILVKGDNAMAGGSSVRDILQMLFPRVFSRLPGACIYWNGFQQSPVIADLRLDHSAHDLEALEVYLDYLSAPMSMMGPPTQSLRSQCTAVIALWSYRPDLPGRTSPRPGSPPR